MYKALRSAQKIGEDWKDRRLILNLYLQQTSVVIIENGDSVSGEIGRVVSQGFILSPLLFSIYAEMVMIEVKEWWHKRRAD